MAIIDVVKFEGPANVLVWKFPQDDLSWGTQVIVGPAQEAIFVKGGQILDSLGPGTHMLKTANIPLLRGLIKLPFGGETPFAAEVYFVNKAVNLEVKWGTQNPIPLLDPVYKVALPVRAFGQFGVRIADSRLVFVQLSSAGSFTTESLTGAFRGVLMARIKDHIAELMINGKVPLLEISGQIEEISEALRQKVAPDFAKWGVELVNFFVNSIDVPEDDPSVQKLKKALADKAELDILGEGYKTKRTFDALEKAAGNEGGAAGAGLGLGMGLGAGVGVGSLMAGALGQAATTKSPAAACSSCRTENAAGATFCSACGKSMAAARCGKCKAELPAGAKFCSACGQAQ